jgi:hypothetical protein
VWVCSERLPAAPQARPRVCAVVELLHTELAYRFGVDVAIGDAALLHARGDDVALGGKTATRATLLDYRS